MKNNFKLKKFLKAIRLNESTISTVLGALVVVVVGVLIYNYFTSVNKSIELPIEPKRSAIIIMGKIVEMVKSSLSSFFWEKIKFSKKIN